MPDPSNPPEIPFERVLDALLDEDTPLAARYLYRFSDLDQAELKLLARTWPKVPEWRRKALLDDIEQLGEQDTLLSFEGVGLFALGDSSPEVRALAVQTLLEYENSEIMRRFLDLIETDPDEDVRAAAAAGLGNFIYLGEVEKIDAEQQRKIEDRLLSVVNGNDSPPVRRNALEALGFSSRDEAAELIVKAYKSGDTAWIASALFAMGRSADTIWKPQVLAMLDNPSPRIRAEAARAAGELEATEATRQLVELLDDPDQQTRLASIWSLSQLGGAGVQKIFDRLYEDSDDDEEREFIESAIDNLAFNTDMQLLPILDLSEITDDLGELYDDDRADLAGWEADDDEMDDESDDEDEFDEYLTDDPYWYDDEDGGDDDERINGEHEEEA